MGTVLGGLAGAAMGPIGGALGGALGGMFSSSKPTAQDSLNFGKGQWEM